MAHHDTAFPGSFKNSSLAQAWLVLILAVVFGVALAAVEVNLKARIAANKLNETIARVPELVWGKSAADRMRDNGSQVDITPGILTVEKAGRTAAYPLYRVSHGGQLAGWVIKTGGRGYADKIEILLGLNPRADTITGLFVLEQKETPGLGNKIIMPEWRGQFIQKPTASPLMVGGAPVAGGNTIDAITGATISSRSVTGIVNRTLGDINGRLTSAAVQYKKGLE